MTASFGVFLAGLGLSTYVAFVFLWFKSQQGEVGGGSAPLLLGLFRFAAAYFAMFAALICFIASFVLFLFGL